MSNLKQITTALCLPAPDLEALVQGKIISCLSRGFIDVNREFALYPASILPGFLPPDKYYHQNFLFVAHEIFKDFNYQQTSIKSWAICEQCKALANINPLEIFSNLTIWQVEALQKVLDQYPNIFLTYLRVYFLEPFKMPTRVVNVGDFISLPKPLLVSNASPVLSDRVFAQRKQQLEELKPPLHPELEDLLSITALSANKSLAARKLEQDIRIFLGWAEASITSHSDSDLNWIGKIAVVGNSSNGDEFEKLVRKALVKLNFTNSNTNPKASLDPESTGGPGGLDFYCESPYSVVGECKASKSESVPNSVSAQLIHLGNTHLGKSQFNSSIKIIFAAGSLTEPAKKASLENQMNVIRPETLQRLVELKAKYEGSIDLLELKSCLEVDPFGEEADVKLNLYIEQVLQKVKLRSHIVKVVRKHSETVRKENVEAGELHTAYIYSDAPCSLEYVHFRDILIELSSPLTGYLGRVDGTERFYFLRDFLID